jgi:hypothetical protein
VTRRIHEAPNDPLPAFVQPSPYERRVDEVKEGFMLHTKTTYPSATKGWSRFCRGTSEEEKKKCPVGIPYDLENIEAETTKEGYARNCYQHDRIQYDLVPKLEDLLTPVLKKFHLDKTSGREN